MLLLLLLLLLLSLLVHNMPFLRIRAGPSHSVRIGEVFVFERLALMLQDINLRVIAVSTIEIQSYEGGEL